MSSDERSAQTQQSRDEPTASAAEANSANPSRRRNTVNHFAVWARVVAGVVLVVSVIAVVFFAGFFTEREYGDLLPALEFAALEGSLVPAEEPCIQLSCSPAGRFGQRCRQVVVPC
ncbi:MAG: hypothetical protein JO259_13450 [Mycobacterium sp.]|nr:hypothetical protein [Mycobacterium sp.]